MHKVYVGNCKHLSYQGSYHSRKILLLPDSFSLMQWNESEWVSHWVLWLGEKLALALENGTAAALEELQHVASCGQLRCGASTVSHSAPMLHSLILRMGWIPRNPGINRQLVLRFLENCVDQCILWKQLFIIYGRRIKSVVPCIILLTHTFAQQLCYWPDGTNTSSRSLRYKNCYSDRDSHCCDDLDVCVGNGLCYGGGIGFVDLSEPSYSS